jgi:hypothetical protein
MLSMLSCLESSQTLMGIQTFHWVVQDGKLGIQVLLSCKLHRIFLESGNCLLDACDIDNCHIKALSIVEK